MGAGPLGWLRVVDCTTGRLTMAGGLLAEYGADVVKVEPPGGDPTRLAMPSVHATNDRGKRSVTVDPSTADGRAVIEPLLRSADVLIMSWDAPFAGVDWLRWESVNRVSPALVYASITGWGEGALDRHRPAHEPLIDAWLGTMGEQAKMARFMRGGPRGPERDGPIYYGMPMASTGASYLSVIGILAAIWRRLDDGRGRHVATSLVDGALSYLSCPWRDGDVPPPPLSPGRNFVSYVRCSDDEFLGIHTGAVGAFDRLMAAIGLDDRIPPATSTAASFAMAFSAEDIVLLDTVAPQIFASRSSEEWEKVLTDADVCCVPCLRPGDMFDHPQVAANNMAVTVDDPFLGKTTQIGVATKFTRTPGSIQRPAPRPGEHTGDVLTDRTAGGSAHDVEPTGAIDTRPLLDGVRVLDLGQYYAGPFGARLLGDLGADVIKLEPIHGDPLRGMDPGGPSEAAQFRKRSIAVDLKSPEGRDIAHRLFEWADIVHHNMRPGVAERLGLGYENAIAINPNVIYDFAPGWGGDGPYVARQGFAPMYSGFVGAAFEVSGAGNPPIPPVGHEDPGNGLLGAAGMIAALLHRRRTGEGQLVEHSQLSATMTHMRHIVRLADGTVVGPNDLDTQRLGQGAFNRVYAAADGWICVVVTDASEQQRLLVALLPDREASNDAGEPELEQAFAGRTLADLVQVLESCGIAHEFAPMNNASAVMRDEDFIENRRVHVWRDPRRGRVREVDHLLRVSDASLPAGHQRPLLGEHTSEILLDLGYTAEEITNLYSANVIRAAVGG